MGKGADITTNQFSNAYPAYLLRRQSRWLTGAAPIAHKVDDGWYYPNYQYEQDSGIAPADGTGEASTYGYNMVRFVEEAINNNPFRTAAAYDPQMDLDVIEQQIDSYIKLIADQNPDSRLTSAAVTAKAMIDASLPGESDLATLEASYEEDTRADYLRRKTAYAVQYYDINATTSSPAAIALALVDMARQQDLSGYNAKVRGQLTLQKAQVLDDSIRMIFAAETQKIESYRVAAQLVSQFRSASIVATNDQYARDLELDSRDVLWPIDILMKGLSTINSLSGVPLAEAKPSKMEQALASILGPDVQAGMAVGQALSPLAGAATWVASSIVSSLAAIYG
jgi:hypothetical protein